MTDMNTRTDLVERLEAMADFQDKIAKTEFDAMDGRTYREAAAALAAAHARAERLEAALKPFANLDFGGYTLPQNEQIIMRFECSVREINAARAALAASQKEDL